MDTEEIPHCAGNAPPAPSAFIAAYGYAGFLRRFAALLIDVAIISTINFGIGVVLCVICGTVSQIGEDAMSTGGITDAIIGWLYFALFESSRTQATPGKMVVGIKVTDAAGNRIPFGRASVRHICKTLSALLLFMVAFTQKKQGLHDIMTRCLVINKAPPTRAQNVVVAAITLAGFIIIYMMAFG